MANLSGIERSGAVGRKFFDLLPGDFERNLATPIHQAFSHQLACDGGFSLRYAENELFSFQYRVAKLGAEDSSGVVMVSLIDKSEHDRLLRKSKKQERLSLVGTLSSGIAHELADPLDAICEAINKMLASDGNSPGGYVEQGLHKILDEVHRISHLSNNFVALARHQAPSLTHLNLHDVIWEAVTVMEHNLNRRPVFSIRLGCNAAPVAGDPVLLRNMLTNLLKNAIEAAGDDAVPLLETSCPSAESIVIRIEDRGSIHATETNRIFEVPFQERKFELGSDMGLYLSKKIIEAHKGTISATRHSGRGMVYTIKLPLLVDFFIDEEIA